MSSKLDRQVLNNGQPIQGSQNSLIFSDGKLYFESDVGFTEVFYSDLSLALQGVNKRAVEGWK